jgi:hypothetical protein
LIHRAGDGTNRYDVHMRNVCFAVLLSLPLWSAGPVTFRSEEIAGDLKVVYAITTADVNRDGKQDIVAISNNQLLWFENPTWKRNVVLERTTGNDNVTIAPLDIDKDGKLDFALGADWQSTNTASGGSLQWVTQTGEVHDIATEPTLHRIRWIDVDGDDQSELVVAPLHGKGTKAPDWSNGSGARILVFRVPKDPVKEPWPVEVADESLHIVHNLVGVGREIWVASAEGVYALQRAQDGKWSKRLIGEGKPGEIKLGYLNGKRHLATVEPWHGAGVVVYEESGTPWKRTVIETGLNQAHALAWGDFERDGNSELVVGWRGKPWGLALYRPVDGKWTKTPIDDGVAVEDLAIADLDSDGCPEIIAGGRTTNNIRIYWLNK